MGEQGERQSLINLFLLLDLLGFLSRLVHLLLELSLVDRCDSVDEEASDDEIPELQ